MTKDVFKEYPKPRSFNTIRLRRTDIKVKTPDFKQDTGEKRLSRFFLITKESNKSEMINNPT